MLKNLENGVAFFEQFDLILPKKSVISMPSSNLIKIDTDKLSIMIKSVFEGFVATLPHGFIENYIGIERDKDNHLRGAQSYKVKIDIDVTFKLTAFLTKGGWEYYNWIDSFLDQLDKKICKGSFFDKIGWETALTISFINRKRRQSSKQLLTSKQNKLIESDGKEALLKDPTDSIDSSYV